MTVEQVIGLSLSLCVMLIGVAGSFLPGLPGPPLVLIVAVLHRLYFGATGASYLVIGLLLALTLVSLLLDYLATMIGARKLGATWKGILGATLGVMIGVLFGFPGIILGPFLGALTLEMIGGRSLGDSGKAGLGAVLGLLGGALGKVACCLAMTGVFAVSVIWNSIEHNAFEAAQTGHDSLTLACQVVPGQVRAAAP